MKNRFEPKMEILEIASDIVTNSKCWEIHACLNCYEELCFQSYTCGSLVCPTLSDYD